MNLNRDNYEEYFLLYADNELSDSEKASVLLFVKENRDLEEEFRAILLTVSRPEPQLTLPDKSFLLKGAAAPLVHEKNREEIFVLYHDQELDAAQRLETESFLLQHPQYRQEFDLIGLARLAPEPGIGFGDKRPLYRKEPGGKVVPLFFRWVAAALFAGAILWLGVSQWKRPSPNLASAGKGQVRSAPVAGPSAARVQTPAIPRQSPDQPLARRDAHDAAPQRAPRVTPAPHRDRGEMTARNQPHGETPSAVVADNTLPARITGRIGESVPAPGIASGGGMRSSLQAAPVPVEIPRPVARTAAPVDVTISPQGNDNYVFYDVKADAFKKTRLGGFLKKVRRVVERTNPIAQLLSGDGHPLALK